METTLPKVREEYVFLDNVVMLVCMEASLANSSEMVPCVRRACIESSRLPCVFRREVKL